MLLWVLRGLIIGALIGCAHLAAAGYLLGSFVGSLASLTSLGNPELVRREARKLAAYGAVCGMLAGSIVGGLMGISGHVRVVSVGALVGALTLALGGAAFGSVTLNDAPIHWRRVVVLSLVGAGIGGVVGVVLGGLASPLDAYVVRRLRVGV